MSTIGGGLGPEWKKSRRSQTNGNCLEARYVEGSVEVRDSKDRGGPVLRFTPAEWLAFAAGMKDGEFDIAG